MRTGTRSATRRRYLITALLVALFATEVSSKNRLYRRFDHRNGLHNTVTALGQDAEGYIWIGAIDDLLRFDGREFRRWNRDKIDQFVSALKRHPDLGMLALAHPEGQIYRIVEHGLQPVFTQLDPVFWFDVAADGSVWCAERRGNLVHRGPDGRWHSYGAERFGGKPPWQVFAAAGGGAYVATEHGGLWRLRPDGSTELMLGLPSGKRVAQHPNGALYVTSRGSPSKLFEIKDGVARKIDSWMGRPVSVVVRGEDVWVSSRGLRRYRPGGTVEIVDKGVGDVVPASAELFVDHEDSLWLGGFDGLVQMPEPDTFSFTHEDGLPVRPGWYAPARTSEGLWVGFWDGMGLIRTLPDGSFEASSARRVGTMQHMCVDRRDRLWTFALRALEDSAPSGLTFLERAGGRFRFHPMEGKTFGDCANAADGAVWFHVGNRLYRTSEEGGPPRFVASLPVDPLAMTEQDGRLWLGGDAAVWSAEVGRVAAADGWTREAIPSAGRVAGIHVMPSGTPWVGGTGGLYRRAEHGWEAVPGAPVRTYYQVTESPRGGVWLTSSGPVVRVAERRGPGDGLEVLETLSVWQGMTEPWNRELIEDEDGTLWITAADGVIRMPPRARFAERPVPSVAVVDALVDGARLSLSDPIVLPGRRNRMELHFSALSYRDPALIRFRVRSRPGEPWTETRTPNVRFTDLAPGKYQPQVVASLDGENWSVVPASLAFRVLPPWYLSWWAMTLFASVAGVALYVIHRVRLAMLLRLERQRTRIAMDLHDEMGAGLGSIGLLADLVRDERIGDGERRGIAKRIATTAGELGANLRDILWSLRPDGDDIGSLAAHLAERGTSLFPGDGVSFRAEVPDVAASVRLSLPVRRNLQRIALEALHNAARHAGARNVVLGFEPAGGVWHMIVHDDGCGIAAAAGAGKPRHGMGLANMEARAEQIEATIRWLEPATGGTEVRVTFRTDASDRRVTRR